MPNETNYDFHNTSKEIYLQITKEDINDKCKFNFSEPVD